MKSRTMTMNDLVKSVKFTGGIGVVGFFLPQDPKGADEDGKEGKITFDMGEFWFKGQRMGTGQANVKHYNRELRDLIHAGKAKPSWIISHELPLARRRAPTSTSTPATRVGPRWCSSRSSRRCERTKSGVEHVSGQVD